jgi:hypothetical protein
VRDQGVARRGIGDVGGPGGQPLSVGVELFGQGVERVLGAGGHDHIGTLSQRPHHALAAEPPADAGDDDGLSLEQHRHCLAQM